MSTQVLYNEISLLIFWAYMEWPCNCHLLYRGTLQNTKITKMCIFQLFVAFSLNYKKESFFKAQIKMIISSTSAFQFLKFQKHHFLIYLSVWPLHVKCTLARHLSHSRIRFDVILVYNRSLVELTTRSWEMRSTSKLHLGNYVVLYQGVSGRLIIIQSIMYWAIITFHNHLYDMIVIDISILSSFDKCISTM